MVFIKAEAGPPNVGDPNSKFTVHYFDDKGNMTIRSDGTRAWRCNNPGALLKSPYSIGKDRRSIGIAGHGKYEYAVYPDYETGHQALIIMLRGSKYSPLTLEQASLRYVEEDPGHIHKIVEITKLDSNRTIKSLTDEEFDSYWKAIEHNERWLVGTEDFIEKWYITGVHKKRGVIYEYCIKKTEGNHWISKVQAIDLSFQNRLHAVMVHLKNGLIFLRPEYGSKPFLLVES